MRKILLPLIAVLFFVSQAFAISDQYKVLAGTGFATRANYTADTNGTAYCFTGGAASDFVFWLDADYVSGASTVDVRIEHSPDKQNWKTLESFTQVTTTDGIQTFHINHETTHVMRCVRAVIDVGAGSPVYNLLVRAHYKLTP